MIQESILNRFHSFRQKSIRFCRRSPFHMFDNSWPSISLLSYYLESLRGNEELSNEELEKLKDGASYIAVLAHECWKAFGKNPEVTDGPQGIEIRVRNDSADSASLVVHVEKGLEKTLLHKSNLFQVLEGFKRDVSLHDNLISLFAIGVMTGFSPYASGSWGLTEEEETAKHFESVSKALAVSCSSHYQRLFPDEPIGQLPELYLNGLIYPPTYFGEGLPCLNASLMMSKWLKEYNFTKEAILKFARNLSLIADEQISNVGLVIYAAYMNETPDQEVLAVAERRGAFMGLLRKAMNDIRATLSLGENWVSASDWDEELKNRFRVERRMGFLPWLAYSKEQIYKSKEDPALSSIVNACLLFDHKKAVTLCDERILDNPKDIETRIQRIFLEILADNITKANSMLRALLSEPEAESSSVLYYLLGITELGLEHDEDAERYLRNAYSMTSQEKPFYEEIIKSYLLVLSLRKNWEEFALVLSESKAKLNNQVSPLILLFQMYKKGSFEREAEACLQELLEKAPLDRRVFAISTQGF